MQEQQPNEGHTIRMSEPTYANPYRLPQLAPIPLAPDVAPAARRRPHGRMLVVVGLLLLGASAVSQVQVVGGFTEQTIEISKSFQARNLDLQLSSGSVTLTRGSDETISVKATQHGFAWNAANARRVAEEHAPIFTENSDTLWIHEQDTSHFVMFGRSPYADYDITLPADAEISVAAGSGTIRASDLSGKLTLTTGSGDLKLRRIGGELTGKTGSGSIIVDDGSLTKTAVQTGSGNIEVTGTRGTINAQTGSGSIAISNADEATLKLQTGSGNLEFAGSLSDSNSSATTSSGNVTLKLPATTNAQVEAQTGSGGISSDWAMQGDEDQRTGRIGSGGATLKLKTGSGNIEIKRK